eukprot:TRINITY_DN27295_c0_g1_i1.p1 TRINITY_DN27295_c0_g1~~TRINITY_DN27295_c0_g1_i1.p1  ORF type:complete len:1330 (-),score=204.20 TRINITY_DN27295_c0_g1_i1:48-4037(-)
MKTFLFSWIVIVQLGQSARGSSLEEVFAQKRCYSETEKTPSFGFRGYRRWVLEVNAWTSQRLVSTIAGILLRECVGYSVSLNAVESALRTPQRVAKKFVAGDGDAVAARLKANEDFGYANLEVWTLGQSREQQNLLSQGRFREAGPIGYTGQSGWWVSQSWAEHAHWRVTPEFYRAYDSRRNSSQEVLRALREQSAVDCQLATVCCCGSAQSCGKNGKDGELSWCPHRVNSSLPAVLAQDPMIDAGFNEELAQSQRLGFNFALRFLGQNAFSQEASAALASGAAQVVHAWRPSVFLSRLRVQDVPILRLMLPSFETCGSHNNDASGDWACDFPVQDLRKLVSLEVELDSVAMHFFSQFNLSDRRKGGLDGMELQGAGIQDLTDWLAMRSNTTASAEDIFQAACSWVRENEADWKSWVLSRNVPMFADTLHFLYPIPTLMVVLLLAIAYLVFLENPWLWTTLSIPVARKILQKNQKRWRSELDERMRERKAASASLATPLSSTASERTPVPGVSAPSVRSGFDSLTTVSQQPLPIGVSTDPEPPLPTLGADYWKGVSDRSKESDRAQEFWREADEWVHAAEKWSSVPEEAASSADRVRFAQRTFPCFQHSREVVLQLLRSDAGTSSGKRLVVEVEVGECDGGAKAKRDFTAGTHRVELAPGQAFAELRVPVEDHKDAWQNSYWFQAQLTQVLDGEGMLAVPVKTTVLVLDENTWPCNIPDSQRQGYGISLLRYFIRADRLRQGEKWNKTMIAMIWLPVHSVVVSTLVQKILVDHVVHKLQTADSWTRTAWPYWECLILVMVQLVSLGLNRWADVVQTRNRSRTGGIRQVHRSHMMRKFMHLERAEFWEASESHWLYSMMYDVDVATGSAYFQVFVMAQSIFALVLSILLVCGLAAWSHVVRSEKSSVPSPVSIQTTWYIVPAHRDARDTMNDTQWVTHWIQGIAYCLMLLFGTFALAEHEAYGIGVMEVGTFYALCKVYLTVGKYIGRLSHSFVDMQRAIVSLRDIAALLNQKCQNSQRREATRLASCGGMQRRYSVQEQGIRFENGVSFIRPKHNKQGVTFSDLVLRRGCMLPLGRQVHVVARNERVLRSFLGLAAEVIHPTEVLPDMTSGRIIMPAGLSLMMLPTVPIAIGIDGGVTILQQLEFTGASKELILALVEAVGLEPHREASSLGPGMGQIFSIIRALLVDPDVLCAFRPLALVPLDMQRQVAQLLCFWQGGGGLPRIAKCLGVSMPKEEAAVYRPVARTLILGNSKRDLPVISALEVHLDLDELLWTGPARETEEGPVGTTCGTPLENQNHLHLNSGATGDAARPEGCISWLARNPFVHTL